MAMPAALLIGLRGGGMSGEDITKHIRRSFTRLYPGRRLNAQTIRQSVITNLLKQGHDLRPYRLLRAINIHLLPKGTAKAGSRT